jgi:DNA-binding GntR family transcriptional regulator
MIRDSARRPLVAGIRPPTLSEAVLQELRHLLIQGRFGPGDVIGVDQLAREFGVSALPVREAVRVLVAEGRVEHSPHRGYRVRTLAYGDVEEIYLMCRLLEGEALRRGVPLMGAEGVERMTTLLERLEADTGDIPLWERVAIHQDFHFVPVESAGLSRITATLRRLWDHTDHYRSLHFFHKDGSPLIYDDHHELLSACASGDGELVVELMDRHREHVLEEFRAAMDEPQPGAGDTA